MHVLSPEIGSSNASTHPSNFFISSQVHEGFWVAPPTSVIKINCDGVWSLDNRKARVACVARDSRSIVIGVRVIYKEKVFSCADPEAYGVLKVLEWVKLEGWSKCIIETDCVEVYNAILKGFSFLSTTRS